MRRALGLLALAASLAGCPTRELYLQEAEAPWAAERIARVELPTFEAPARAWTLADRARRVLREALDRGTVRVVDQGADGRLLGAIANHQEQSTPGAPRRVQRQSGSSGPLPPGPNFESWAWELDVTHVVQLTLAVRLENARGSVVWSRESVGEATETQALPLNWPGSDMVAPPPMLPRPPDPELLTRLREKALGQALEPLLAALTMRYGYREVK